VTNPSPLAKEFFKHGRSESCPVIDMHGHYGPFSGIYFPSPYAEGMLASMDRCGIACIVVSGHTALTDPARGNREIADLVRGHSGRFYGYCAINPDYPEQMAQDLQQFATAEGFLGLKLHPEWHSYPLTGDRYAPALEYAAAHGLLVLTHTWGGSEYDGPNLAAEVAGKYPGATFLMGHAGYGDWDDAFAVAREHDNCYLELTAAYRVGGIIERMVGEVGSHKIVFGTDLPWFDPTWGIGAVCFSRIGDDARHDILHRNAERLLAPFRERL
jgi:predicted TIM-barrel fold metal-dependent hydrolase